MFLSFFKSVRSPLFVLSFFFLVSYFVPFLFTLLHCFLFLSVLFVLSFFTSFVIVSFSTFFVFSFTFFSDLYLPLGCLSYFLTRFTDGISKSHTFQGFYMYIVCTGISTQFGQRHQVPILSLTPLSQLCYVLKCMKQKG